MPANSRWDLIRALKGEMVLCHLHLFPTVKFLGGVPPLAHWGLHVLMLNKAPSEPSLPTVTYTLKYVVAVLSRVFIRRSR
jgi:hypothetical protein